jgi:ribonuclease HII
MSLSRLLESTINEGYDQIIGIDEAGRGPLAGPVVVASCLINENVLIEGIMDSKKTSETQRCKLYEVLTNHSDVIWSVSIVSHEEIDKVNILQATMLGMSRSANELVKKNKKLIKIKNCIALIDGNRIPTDMPIYSKFVIKGDSCVFSIAAASIIAKVTRDRIMLDLHVLYPIYNFAQHKGYPTFEHRSLVFEHGPCEVHRATFGPVKQAIIALKNRNEVPKSAKKVLKDNKKNIVKSQFNLKDAIISKKNTNVNKKTKLKPVSKDLKVISSVILRRSARIQSSFLSNN